MGFKALHRSPLANKRSNPTPVPPPQHFPFLVSSKCFSKLLVVLLCVNQYLTNQHFPAFRSRPHTPHGSLPGTTRSDELSQTPTVVPTAYNPRFKLFGMAQGLFLWSPISYYTSSSNLSLPHLFHFSSILSLPLLLHHFLFHSIASTHLLHHFIYSLTSIHLLHHFHYPLHHFPVPFLLIYQIGRAHV